MANFKAVTLQSGTYTLAKDADTLLVGSGIDANIAQPLAVGGALATALNLGKVGILTTILGTANLAGNTTIGAGATLSTTGTGQINLPNNASARFQVEGTSVGATVTAANFNTLTNGSNADALHTHSFTGGSSLVITGLTTAGLATGDATYVSASNTLSKTSADAIGTARFFGVYTGTAGSAQVAGVANITLNGANPSFGAPVFLETTGPNQGKVTATAPSTAGAVVAEVGITLATPGGGVVTALLQPKAPIQL